MTDLTDMELVAVARATPIHPDTCRAIPVTWLRAAIAADRAANEKDRAAAAWTASTEQALRRRVAELEQEAAAMQRRIEDMAREMAAFMDAMQRHPGAP